MENSPSYLHHLDFPLIDHTPSYENELVFASAKYRRVLIKHNVFAKDPYCAHVMHWLKMALAIFFFSERYLHWPITINVLWTLPVCLTLNSLNRLRSMESNSHCIELTLSWRSPHFCCASICKQFLSHYRLPLSFLSRLFFLGPRCSRSPSYSSSEGIVTQVSCSDNLGRFVLEISPAPPFNVGDTNAINGHECLPQHWTGGKGRFFPAFIYSKKILGGGEPLP